MSGNLERKLSEDRVLRNAAWALVKADIDQIKKDFGARNIGTRFTRRMSEGATDVFEEAVEVADNNRGVLATLIGAIVLWFARNPIMAIFDDVDQPENIDGNDERDDFEEPERASNG